MTGVAGTDRLGSFRLLRRLGVGAMGTVFLAQDEEEDRPVALKLFHPQVSDRDGFFTRFRREADAGSRVVHPNVVRTYGAELQVAGDTARCFLVMEYVEGKSLRELLDEMKQVPEALVREIGRQIAAGLTAIHAAEIVHRDLKPENVLITPDHDVRVMDLGVSKLLDATKVLTQEGQFAGSLLYAAPEQIQGRPVTGATDLYALGVLLHELATGVNPFERDTSGGVVRAHLLDDPPDLLDEAPDATPFLGEVVRTLLAKDPSRRFASAAELELALSKGESSAWWRTHEDDAIRRRARIPRVPVRRETEIHGRADDLALLRTAWERARAGNGNSVLLLGEAGIGKSRLIDAFLSDLRTADAHVLYGSWPPFGGMGAITDAIVANLGAEDLDEKIRRYLPDSPLLAAPLAALLRHEPPPAGSVSLQGDALHAALVRLLHGLAAERPVVWVIEDLHFADADARKIVLSLARAVEGRPVLLLLSSRPGLPESELAHFDRLENLRKASLARLGAREVVLLLKDAFRSTHLAEKLGGKVALASDGNPFFVFETIRALKQGQLIAQLPDGTWIDTQVIESIPVPPAVRDLVEARLGDLSQAQREFLDIGAVQGFEFDADLVAAVLGRKRFEVLRDLAQIERTTGVVRSVGRRFRFDHHQIQEIVYADLSVPLREECHAALADAIERREDAAEKDPATLDGDVAVDLAEHFLKGRLPHRALRYVSAAQAAHAAAYRNQAAATLADAALAVPALLSGDARARLLLQHVGVLQRLATGERLLRAADDAIAAADSSRDAGLRVAARVRAGFHLGRAGRPADAEARLDEAEAICRDAGGAASAAEIDMTRGTVLQVSGRMARAREFFERAWLAAEAAGRRDTAYVARANLGVCLQALGHPAEARVHHTAALAAARLAGSKENEAWILECLGNATSATESFEAALPHHEQSLALRREMGHRPGEAGALQNVSAVLYGLGRLDEAESLLLQTIEIHRATGALVAAFRAGWGIRLIARARGRHAGDLAWIRSCDENPDARIDGNWLLRVEIDSAGCLATLGRTDDAAARIRRALDAARKSGSRVRLQNALLTMARVERSRGDFGAAERALHEALRVAHEAGLRHEADTLTMLGWNLVDAGRGGEAGPHLEAVVDGPDGKSLTADVVIATALLAQLGLRSPSDAVARFAEAEPRMEHVDRMSARYLLWKATGDRSHVAEAMRLLDALVDGADPECRESIRTGVWLHRAIADASEVVHA